LEGDAQGRHSDRIGRIGIPQAASAAAGGFCSLSGAVEAARGGAGWGSKKVQGGGMAVGGTDPPGLGEAMQEGRFILCHAFNGVERDSGRVVLVVTVLVIWAGDVVVATSASATAASTSVQRAAAVVFDERIRVVCAHDVVVDPSAASIRVCGRAQALAVVGPIVSRVGEAHIGVEHHLDVSLDVRSVAKVVRTQPEVLGGVAECAQLRAPALEQDRLEVVVVEDLLLGMVRPPSIVSRVSGHGAAERVGT
tara:strand:+ start:796 stop:1548 length:753 start_codon:yes stop_codon:yes gene_type:complete